METRSLGGRVGLAIGRNLAHPRGLVGWATAQAMQVANRKPTRALIDALEIGPNDHVLDLGCGEGSVLAAIPQAAFRCGIDRSETMIALAGRKLRGPIAAGTAKLLRGDMMDLPFAAGTFDQIIASNILYFCDDVPAFIAECRRVARHGARLGIYVTDAGCMRDWFFAPSATHRLFDKSALRNSLAASDVLESHFSIERLDLHAGVKGLVAVIRLHGERARSSQSRADRV